ncbi:Nuclear pore protein [Lasiodiplodia theobromae]|uniref:Nuclear pore protein n=1 Tax=Lasiodiplodia theobromae TaxID=45133 RepID=UPI0015C3C42C|nr:Nuclear pore protein [Lasiodiplodia theobromae]KAF4534778.1 Nuclear pore protein [Lasiodiplodia theobromae]
MEDDPDALALLLRIAHLKFNEVPRALSLDALYEVAVLTDKYFATSLVKPWIKQWIEPLKISRIQWHDIKWLWIGWEFGDEDLFNRSVQWLLKDSDDLEQYLQDPEIATPPGLLESIAKARTKTINKILDEIYKYVDQYRVAYTPGLSSGFCIKGPNARKCDALVFGSLALTLLQLGLTIDRRKSASITESINTIAEKVQSMQIYECDDDDSDHESCTSFQTALQSKVAKTVRKIPSPIQESHQIHLTRKKGLCS